MGDSALNPFLIKLQEEDPSTLYFFLFNPVPNITSQIIFLHMKENCLDEM